MDFVVRHARLCDGVEKPLSLKEPAGRLKNNQISLPRCIERIEKRDDADVGTPTAFKVVGHAHRPAGCQPCLRESAWADLLCDFTRIEFGNLVRCKVSGDVPGPTTNCVQVERVIGRPGMQLEKWPAK